MAGTQAAGGAGSLDYEAFLAAFDRGFNVAKVGEPAGQTGRVLPGDTMICPFQHCIFFRPNNLYFAHGIAHGEHSWATWFGR
jgi:hypothetical protein